jgi:hypothetical protein
MGRPLNKKYFGNRNIGTNSGYTADDGIGGEGLASISVATAGSFVVSNTYKNFPLLNIGAPDLLGGVQATADVVFEIDTVTYSSGGATGYLAGLSTSITGLGGGAVVNITTNGGGAVNAVNLTGGNRGEFRRGGAFDGTGITTFQVLQAPNVGTDLQISITFRVKSITIVNKGSGYITVPSLSWNGHTFTGQTIPSGNTPVLTTDSGGYNGNSAQNVTTNQENAILIYAKTASGGSVLLGDITKQQSSRRYKVKTTDGTTVVKLVAATPGFGEATITATDSSGKTYYVTKLTAHKARLTPYGTSGHEFPLLAGLPQSVKWTFGAAALGDTVQIANA